MGDRGRKEGRKKGGVNRTEAGNDELREQTLIFHFDRLSSVRRQRRWLLCPERRHLLLAMQTSAFMGLCGFFWNSAVGTHRMKNV